MPEKLMLPQKQCSMELIKLKSENEQKIEQLKREIKSLQKLNRHIDEAVRFIEE